MAIKKISSKTIGEIFLPLFFSSLCLCLFSAHAAFFIGFGISPVGHVTLAQRLSTESDDQDIKDEVKRLNKLTTKNEKAVDLDPGVDFQFGIDLPEISHFPFRLSVNRSMLGSGSGVSVGSGDIFPVTKTTFDLQYMLPITKTEALAIGGYIGKEKWKYQEDSNPVIPDFTILTAIQGVSIGIIAQVNDEGSSIEVGYKKTLHSSRVKKKFKVVPISSEFHLKRDDVFYIHYIYSFGHKSKSEDV